MDFPLSFTLFHHRVPWHVVIEPLAMFTGYRYYVHLRKKKGDVINNQNRLWILLGAILGAVAGSRLIGGLENIPRMLQAPHIWLYFYQNKTVLGGLLGGIAGVELVKKGIGEKQNSGDLFVYPLLLAIIIGRLGCFSMGVHEETYGTVTHSFAGINLGDGWPRHPVTLYEIAFMMVLWRGLRHVQKNYRLANGLLFKLFIIAYCIFRFAIEYLKPRYTIAGLSVIQMACIAGLCYYGLVWLFNKRVYSWKKKNASIYA